MNRTYEFFKSFFAGIISTFYRWKVIGAEQIPCEEGLVVCANHISNWDPLLLGSSFPRQIRYMAKEELFHIPLVGFLVRRWGAYPVKRGSGDRQAIKKSIEIARNGEVIGIFPEGTRSKTGKLGKALPGAALIAQRSGVRVVPAAIIGPYRLFRPITIIFGAPFDLKELSDGKGNMAMAAEIIMNEIQKLMDENDKHLRKSE